MTTILRIDQSHPDIRNGQDLTEFGPCRSRLVQQSHDRLVFFTNEWRDSVILTREIALAGERSDFYNRTNRGEFTRLFRGVYVRSEEWAALDGDARYRLRVYAAAAIADGPVVVSHDSAAGLWRLPSVEGWPSRVHTVAPPGRSVRSSGTFITHARDVTTEAVSIDGVQATTLARTVVDVAATRGFAHAVAVSDAALRRTEYPVSGLPTTLLTLQDLRAEAALVPLRHGSSRVARAIEFASGLADRPGESVSRVSMHLAGLPAPELQVKIYGVSGRFYFVDFWWREFNLMGEFDGKAKYSNAEFLRGRTPEQALLDEKDREDDLRATGRRMSRWGWDKAMSPRLLRAHLMAAGLR